MSWQPCDEAKSLPPQDPVFGNARSVDLIDDVIDPRARDLGGFEVRRALHAAGRQMVGPFIFFDHMGPAVFEPGSGVDVRPHPHIGLATVTYLFEGEFMHRDSLGSAQLIRPGDVNWMVAGRGIVHSERTPPEARVLPGGAPIHGIQSWIALPTASEEVAPSFTHHAATSLPELRQAGVRLRLIAGEAFGERAPAAVVSPMFYLDAVAEAGATVALPEECCLAVRRWTARGTSGGTSSRAARNASSVPSSTGANTASTTCRVTRSGFRSRTGERHPQPVPPQPR